LVSFAHLIDHVVMVGRVLALNRDAGQAGGDGGLDAVRAGSPMHPPPAGGRAVLAPGEHAMALSGPLATLPGTTRVGRPPAPPPAATRQATKVFHLHSNRQRLTAH